VNSNLWNQIISTLPDPHFLQTYEWGQVKVKYGWKPYYAIWTDDGKFTVSPTTENWSLNIGHYQAAALILKRTAFRRFSIYYAPKGPLMDWANESLRKRVLDDLQSLRRSRARSS